MSNNCNYKIFIMIMMFYKIYIMKIYNFFKTHNKSNKLIIYILKFLQQYKLKKINLIKLKIRIIAIGLILNR